MNKSRRVWRMQLLIEANIYQICNKNANTVTFVEVDKRSTLRTALCLSGTNLTGIDD
jgi:hypothetical protein